MPVRFFRCGLEATHLYVAPELFAADIAVVTPAIDVYAYGLLLWCMFQGRDSAWADADGETPSLAQTIVSVSTGLRPELSALRADSTACYNSSHDAVLGSRPCRQTDSSCDRERNADVVSGWSERTMCLGFEPAWLLSKWGFNLCCSRSLKALCEHVLRMM